MWISVLLETGKAELGEFSRRRRFFSALGKTKGAPKRIGLPAETMGGKTRKSPRAEREGSSRSEDFLRRMDLSIGVATRSKEGNVAMEASISPCSCPTSFS